MSNDRASIDHLSALVTVSTSNTIERLSKRFDVRLFGAIGDGQPHPLSSRFGSLVDARRIFPHAETLADTLDWCAIQGAVNEAKAARGGQVYVPAGTYVMGSRTLLMPDSPQGEDADDAVVLAGDGARNTVLRWSADIESRAWAVRLGKRHSYSRVVLRDLHLKGPAASSVRGRPPCRLSGVACSSGWRLERVNVDHFYADVGIWDDHTVHIDCEYGRGSFYGLYFDEGSIDFGDHLFFHCNIGGTLKACVAVSPTNQVEHCLFVDCHMGWSPYVFYRERGKPTRAFITNTRIIKTQAESVGNAWVWGENFDDRLDLIDKCCFEDIQFLRSAEHVIPGAPVAFCRVNSVWNSRIVGPHTIFGRYYDQVTDAYFDTRVFQGNAFVGGYFEAVVNSSADKPFVRASQACIFNIFREGEQFEGELRTVGTPVKAGALLHADGLGARDTGSAPLGVAAVEGRAGGAVPIVTRGLVTTQSSKRLVQPAVQVVSA